MPARVGPRSQGAVAEGEKVFHLKTIRYRGKRSRAHLVPMQRFTIVHGGLEGQVIDKLLVYVIDRNGR